MKNLHVTIIALACVYAVNAYAALKPFSDYDVDDYVQDGLMAQYDGIRNEGARRETCVSFREDDAGKRLDFATNWKTEPSEIAIVRGDGRRETRIVPHCETIKLDVGVARKSEIQT